MRQSLLLALLLLPSSMASANWFGSFRQGPAVNSSYIAPSFNCYYPSGVRIVYPTPVIIHSVPATFRAPPMALAPLAIPLAAPASTVNPMPRAEGFSVPPAASPGRLSTTTMRPGESSYSILPGPRGMDRSDGRCSVAFWNLTGEILSMRIDGRDHVLLIGRSLTLDLPCSFAWHVSGRESEAARIPTGHPTGEVLIRR